MGSTVRGRTHLHWFGIAVRKFHSTVACLPELKVAQYEELGRILITRSRHDLLHRSGH